MALPALHEGGRGFDLERYGFRFSFLNRLYGAVRTYRVLTEAGTELQLRSLEMREPVSPFHSLTRIGQFLNECKSLWVLKKYVNKEVFLPASMVIAKFSSLAWAKQ